MHPVLVRHILHLTDARYFAAMGVDWMSLELSHDQNTFDRWHAIKDWVEGVKLLAEPVDANESLMAKIIIEAKPDGILCDPLAEEMIPEEVEKFILTDSADLKWTQGLYYNIFRVLPDAPEFQQPALIPEAHLFLQADWNPVSLAKVLESGYTGGFCFSGGVEEVTGVRDYGEMDEMLERVRK